MQLGSLKFLGAEYWKSALLDNSPFARLLRLAPMLNPSRNTRSQLLTLCCAGRVGGKGISNRTFHQLCWTAMQLADLSFGFKPVLARQFFTHLIRPSKNFIQRPKALQLGQSLDEPKNNRVPVSPAKAGPQSCQDQ